MVDRRNMNEGGIPEERRFVWRNLDGFLTGQLSEEDRRRVEDFLCECPHTREYVETEQQFADAVRRCMENPDAGCPDGLRERVLAALDRCELEDYPGATHAGNVLRFPWTGAAVLAAASLMLVAALVFVFGGGDDLADAPALTAGMAPLVSRVSMDAPPSDVCHWSEASDEYRRHFPEGPELPHGADGQELKVSHFVCDDVEGSRVMSAVYDSADGRRFGFLTFRCDCLANSAPRDIRCAEIEVDGRIVLLWRERDFMRALVGTDSATLHQFMQSLRATPGS